MAEQATLPRRRLAPAANDLTAGLEQARTALRRHHQPARIEAQLVPLAEEAAATGAHRVLALVRLELATVARYQHDLDRAAELAGTTLDLFGCLQEPCGQAAAHLELAKIDVDRQRDPSDQLERARECVPYPAHEIEAHVNAVWAQVAAADGMWPEAGRRLREAVSLLEDRRAGPYHLARYLARLGMIERQRGAPIAREHLFRAYGLADAFGYERIRAFVILDFGQLALEAGRLRAAHQRLSEAAALFTEIGDLTSAAQAEYLRSQHHPAELSDQAA